MKNGINNMRELKHEKKKRKAMAKEGMMQIKHNLVVAKDESINVLINKILIPVGVGIVAGYGLKKLIDVWRSGNDDSDSEIIPLEYKGDPPIYHRSEIVKPKHRNGLLSNVDWTGMAVRVLPFVLNVGKQMYDDGNLPFFHPPSESGERKDA